MSNIVSYSQKNLYRIVNVLEKGGVVIFPTETVYALACRADDKVAVERIYKIKNRTPEKVFAVLAPSVEFVEKHADIEQKAKSLISKFSPGAVTYVVPVKEGGGISEYVIRGGKTGFRIPNHSAALEILNKCNFPVIATSVNKSGQKSAGSVSEVSSELLSEIDLVMDGEKSAGISSTVISFNENNDLELLREGGVNFEDIQKAWKAL